MAESIIENENNGAEEKPAKRKNPVAHFARQKQASIGISRETAAPAPDAKKKGFRLSVTLIILAVMVLLLAAAAGFCVLVAMNDIFGFRGWFIEKVISLDPEHEIRLLENRERRLNNQETQLNERETELDGRDAALNARESSLNDMELRLNNRNTDLNAREQNIREREQIRLVIFRQPMTEEELEDMTAISRMYAAMEPETAADILIRLFDIEETAAILYFMSERSASAILAVMDSNTAARITEVLLLEGY